MRRYVLAAALLSLPALADGPIEISLAVGETRQLCENCTHPICDDPKVAVLSAEGKGTLTGVGAGKTLCSIATPAGPRQLFEIEVKSSPDGGK